MDFYSEFNDISKSNDKKAMIELLMTELASIIANRREDFLKVLDKSNIRYNPNATDTQLADIFINNIFINIFINIYQHLSLYFMVLCR